MQLNMIHRLHTEGKFGSQGEQILKKIVPWNMVYSLLLNQVICLFLDGEIALFLIRYDIVEGGKSRAFSEIGELVLC